MSIQTMWGSSSSNVFAAGGSSGSSVGQWTRWDGTSWLPRSSFGRTFSGLWGSGPRDIFGVGGTGAASRWNGFAWKSMTPITTSTLNDVSGTGPADVFAVGQYGTIQQWNGSSWSPIESGTTQDLYDVWAAPTGEVFAVGEGGIILKRPRSCAASETACGDGKDEDCDGLIDCADPQCGSDATCLTGGLCTDYVPLGCNSSVAGTTTGGFSRIQRNGCDLVLRSGRERTYRTPVLGTSGNITVSLTGLSRDVDLLVFGETTGGSCNPYNPDCLGVSALLNKSNESVTFAGTAGQRYFVVVDSVDPNTASYNLSLTCP